MKSSIGVAVRVAVGVSVLFVGFAVGVTVAVAVGMPVSGVAVAVPIAGAAIRVSVTVPIGFQSIGSSGNLRSIQQNKNKRKLSQRVSTTMRTNKAHRQSKAFQNRQMKLKRVLGVVFELKSNRGRIGQGRRDERKEGGATRGAESNPCLFLV